MVGRKSVRGRRAGAAASTRTRRSARPIEIPDEGEPTLLREHISQIFKEAQHNIATQRKLVTSLRKIQLACCFEDPRQKNSQYEEFGEQDFVEEMVRCLARILPVKKGEPVGEKGVRFLVIFLKRAIDEDNALNAAESEGGGSTPSDRLAEAILKFCIAATTSSNKVARFRATQIIYELVRRIEQIDNDVYAAARRSLQKRLRDKEASVRVQAVLGFGCLVLNENEDNEEDDSDDELSGNGTEMLMHLLQNDPSAEVRRAVVMNLGFTQTSLRYMLERARDEDAATRRLVYGKVLPALGDFRHLKMVEREKLIRWGLRDRDPLVSKAAARLFYERWIEDCANSHNPIPPEEKKPGEVQPPNMLALYELLERIDVVRSAAEEGEGAAHDCMRVFWEGRPDYREYVTFDDDFWNDLSPESAFVARSLNDYCSSSDDPRLESIRDKIPEASRFSYFIQEYLNRLIEERRKLSLAGDDEEGATVEETYFELEFVVVQLLHIALTLDYTDEVGRQHIFKIMREALSMPELPETCTTLAVDLLDATSTDEKEFIDVVLEAYHEVRDTLAEDEPEKARGDGDDDELEEDFEDARSQLSDASDATVRPKKKQKTPPLDPEEEEAKQIKTKLVYLKCLHIAQCLLGIVQCDVKTHSGLTNMLNHLVIPSVQNHDPELREMGMKCLSLFCLNNRELANDNLHVFIFCLGQEKASEDLRIICLEAITDMLLVHKKLLAPPPAPENSEEEEQEDAEAMIEEHIKKITMLMVKLLNPEAPPVLLLRMAEAASKILLHNHFYKCLPEENVTEVLKAMVKLYFNPENTGHPSVQMLAYCINAFCHSRKENAQLMADIAAPLISKLFQMREETFDDEDAEQMVPWSVITGHIAEWSDARHVPLPAGMPQIDLNGKQIFVNGAEDPHILLAVDILTRAFTNPWTQDKLKPLLMLLGKLHIAPARLGEKTCTVEDDVWRELGRLVEEAIAEGVAPDTTTKNAVIKLQTVLGKRLGGEDRTTATPFRSGGDEDNEQEEEEEDEDRLAQTQIEQETRVLTGRDEVEEDEDTMLAGLQGEGTRMPLEEDDDEDDDESTIAAARNVREGTAVTESDIVDDLLESEMDAMDIDG